VSKKLYPFRKNGRFYFTESHKPESFFLGTVPTFFQSLLGRRRHMRNAVIEPWIAVPAPLVASQEPHVTWLGHATFLIQIGGLNILTDPIFGHPSFLFPRVLPLGIPADQLPPIDAVVISHNHPDHMDSSTIATIKKQSPHARMLVPEGDKAWFDRRGYTNVVEHTWWEDTSMSLQNAEISPVRFTFLPSAHWSQRGVFDKNKSLWGSWMIQWNGYSIYFAGDTAYAHHFANIGHHFPSIDLALMPVGPCEPHEWMAHTHVSAEQSGQAFLDLKAQQFIPMHWGTFVFGYDHFELPIERITKWWQANGHMLENKKLHLCKVGERIDVAAHSSNPNLIQPRDLELYNQY
jgi:L-ascorbate metabolism protein UlaG (beta-lactamase superfamily)